MPFLMFTSSISKTEQAIKFYLSVFKDSKLGNLFYSENEAEQSIMFADFMLENQWVAAMDGGDAHNFSFNEALSLLISCKTQEEIDYYWNKLSADPKSEQCGWLKDKFGVSWQVWPIALGEMMTKGTPQQVARVTQSFLSMKKYDIATLERAFKGT